MTCELCGREIERTEKVCRRLTGGWEAVRAQGGTNHVLAREVDPQRVAHEVCVKYVGNRNQMTLGGGRR